MSANADGPIALPAAGGAQSLLLGRAQAGMAALDHPSVSRTHARVDVTGGAWIITDLGSANGTFVDGAPARSGVKLRDGARVQIGAVALKVLRDALVPVGARRGAHLAVEGVVYRPSPSGPVLLRGVSADFGTGGLSCILGPSGSGKSTLLRAIAGRIRPVEGRVLVDGVDVHASYDSVKHRIGYVPQHEALRNELTVRAMLRYTARLRLPRDVSAREADRDIRDLLARVRLVDRADTKIGALSGGQRRRAGLVNELLARPSLVLLDEVTSGLDEESAHEIMQLTQELSREGMTIVCVTHTIAAVEPYADSVLVLAEGGVPAWFGPTSKLKSAFSLATLPDLYPKLRGRNAAADAPARDNAAAANAPVMLPRNRKGVMQRFREAVILSERYVDVILGDRRALWLSLLQGLIIGGLQRVLFGSGALDPARTLQLGFLIVISSFWFGSSNAVREIVKERALLTQEWAAGIGLAPYFVSKAVVLLLLSSVQVMLLVLAATVTGVDVANAPGLALVGLGGAWTGVCIGLALSAKAGSTDAASVALPLLLIPQLLFAEAVVTPLPDAGLLIAKISVSAYWLFQGVKANADLPGANMPAVVMGLAAHATVALALGFAALRTSLRRSNA